MDHKLVAKYQGRNYIGKVYRKDIEWYITQGANLDVLIGGKEIIDQVNAEKNDSLNESIECCLQVLDCLVCDCSDDD